MDAVKGDFSLLRKKGARIYFIGIKGTGMCALAELLQKKGVLVSGSDGDAVFYTDSILKELKIPYHESFDASHIDRSFDMVIYSAAYSFSTNPEMDEAKRLGIPMYKYTDALGAYSAGADSSGITGVHGKTTTTAIAGCIIKGAGLPGEVLAGSEVAGFGGRSTLSLGGDFFVAETCEYRRHFLSFHPQRIILTSVESDHQDYYPEYSDIRDAFVEYGRLLPPGGELIYCADDPGAGEVAEILKKERNDIKFIPYGFSAEGEYKITAYEVKDERIVFTIKGFPGELKLRIPGKHTVLNTVGALALVSSIAEKCGGWNEEKREDVRKALEGFSGIRRRSEILGERAGILFMDDYGHHPTEIKTTLSGLKEFYPKRRLIVSFMSHTYTRTASLLDDFAVSFNGADMVFLHKIYSSAREKYEGGITGITLYEKVKEKMSGNVFYIEEPDDSFDRIKSILRKGDLFITMGAGDNFRLGKKLFDSYSATGVSQ